MRPLTDKQRVAHCLLEQRGYKQKDAAEMMGISQGSFIVVETKQYLEAVECDSTAIDGY